MQNESIKPFGIITIKCFLWFVQIKTPLVFLFLIFFEQFLISELHI